jgi:hypothetical protein
MTVHRVTQDVVEVLAAPTSAHARITEDVVEVLAQPPTQHARGTQDVVEVLLAVIQEAHGLSAYLKDQLITHIFRSSSLAKPIVLWLALYSLPPNGNGGGTEVTGNGYTRARLNPSDGNWAAPVAGNGVTSNGVDVAFPTPTGSGWGTLTAWGLFDAALGGNLLAFSTFSGGIAVAAGSNPRFVAGALTVTLA